MLPFSKRNTPAVTILDYEIQENVRNRIYLSMNDICNRGRGDMYRTLQWLEGRCLRQYGGMLRSPQSAWALRSDGVQLADIEFHWRNCETEYFLDLLEWIFQTNSFNGNQIAVDAINRILREEGIGYELSPYCDETTRSKDSFGNDVSSTAVLAFPQVTQKSNDVMHSTTVMPALQLLGGRRWIDANKEMLQAHHHLRDGHFREAINMAGCCLESVLKIICDANQWPFKPDKDTLNPLLQAVYAGKLITSPFIEVIQRSTGEIRNKWGGHGQAKNPHGEATYDMAEHMIQITSAHVLLLCKLSKLV